MSVYFKFKHKICAKKEGKRKFKTETMEKKEEGERDPYNQYEWQIFETVKNLNLDIIIGHKITVRFRLR